MQNANTPSTLAQQPAVSGLVYQILAVAQGGGMTEERAKSVYDEIMGHYANLSAEAFGPLVKEISAILGYAARHRN